MCRSANPSLWINAITPVIALLATCSPGDRTTSNQQPTTTAWLTDRAWAVIDAQDHRDTKALIDLLNDTSAGIRAKAALAFASVGDSAAAPSLLHALSDTDAMVRANAAFAFGFCGDSANVHQFIERFSPEENAAVRGRIAEAAGRCGGRDGADLLRRRVLSTKADSLGVLRGLFFAAAGGHVDTSHIAFALSLFTGHDAELDEAAAQVCARSTADLLKSFSKPLLRLARSTRSNETRLALLSALGKAGSEEAASYLIEQAVKDPEPRVRTRALMALGRFDQKYNEKTVWAALQDSIAMVRDEAVELMLAWKEPIDGQTAWTTAQEHSDYAVKIPLYGLAMKYGDDNTRRTCEMLMKSMAHQDLGPYLNAALTKALWTDSDTARAIMLGNSPAVVRQAAMDAWLRYFGEVLKRAEITKSMRDRTHEVFMRAALTSGDAGLIASACEKIMEEDQGYLKELLDVKTIALVRATLHPIRDLEALQDLDIAIAKRDGKPAPKHTAPPFNHPIRAAGLQPGQQYRIRTNKGDITLAIEPDAAPGSCVAFDSLVTAGYYNGKYFHRLVPDFVAQGGCPRGDGYGAMDWTLRTEVGLEGFTTGAVGLASAGKDTESCQFFIMLADAPHLDGRYTRFAHVVSGMEVAWRLRVGDRMTTVERLP